MFPGLYAVFDTATTTRIPGDVTVQMPTKPGEPRVLTYTRPFPKTKGRTKPELVSFTATSVKELSQKIDDYFTKQEIPT